MLGYGFSFCFVSIVFEDFVVMVEVCLRIIRKTFDCVRRLRRVKPIKYTVLVFLLLLMLAGVRVATIPMVFPESVQLNDKFVHLVVFFGFAFLADLVTARRPFRFWKALPLIMYGFGIEVLQYFSPDRSFSLLDGLADVAGVLLYWSFKQVLYQLVKRDS